MKRIILCSVLVMISFITTNVHAYDIYVENEDGVTILYNFINDGRELEVTYLSDIYSYSQNEYTYAGSVVIPEEVTFMNRTRKVTSIGSWAFSYCSGLTSVTIPGSVTSIERAAFFGCTGLTSVTIPNSVTSIGNGAFQRCRGLTSVTIPCSVTSIGDGTFGFCNSLTSVTIPNSVKSIGRHAFSECSSLTSVTIPGSVTIIGSWAFENCSSLTSVNIPGSVKGIGYRAFCGCTGLITVTFPNSVKEIGDNAFDCLDLESVISFIEEPFPISGKTWDNGTFSPNTFNNATLYVPAAAIDKYKATEGWKDFLHIEPVEKLDDAVGIQPLPLTSSPVSEGEAGVWYDLSGRQFVNSRSAQSDASHLKKSLNGKLNKGIYIQDGRKVMVR